MQPTLEPSCVFETSKYIFQILVKIRSVPILILFTSIMQGSLLLVGLKIRSSNYVVGGIKDGGAI